MSLSAEHENILPCFPPCHALELKTRRDFADIMRSNEACETSRQERLDPRMASLANRLGDAPHMKAVGSYANFGQAILICLGPKI